MKFILDLKILMFLFLIDISSISTFHVYNRTTFRSTFFRINPSELFYLPSNANFDIQLVNSTSSLEQLNYTFWNDKNDQIYFSFFSTKPAFLKTEITFKIFDTIKKLNFSNTRTYRFHIDPSNYTIRHILEFDAKNVTGDISDVLAKVLVEFKEYYWTKSDKSENDKLNLVHIEPISDDGFRLQIGSYYEPSEMVQSIVKKSNDQKGLLNYLLSWFTGDNQQIELDDFRNRTGYDLVMSNLQLHPLIENTKENVIEKSNHTLKAHYNIFIINGSLIQPLAKSRSFNQICDLISVDCLLLLAVLIIIVIYKYF